MKTRSKRATPNKKAAPNKKETRTVPDLIKAKDYLLDRFRHDMLQAVYASLEAGELARIMDSDLIVEPFDEAACVFDDVHFYWHTRTDFLADINVMIPMRIREDDGTQATEYEEMLLSVHVCFIEDEHHCEVDEIHSLFNPPDRSGMLELDEYLVPVMKWETQNTHAEGIWLKYYPEAYKNGHLRNPIDLAEKMGLTVEYKYRNLPSPITQLQLAGVGEDSPEKDTITINLAMNGQLNNTKALYQCCIAYEWHYLFYVLQGIGNATPYGLPHKEVPAEMPGMYSPLASLFDQLGYGGLALMIPASFLKKYISDHEADTVTRERCHGYRMHAAAMLEQIGFMLSEEYTLCKSHIRTRMIQIGYWHAKGIFNYTEGGHYTRAFRADEEELRIPDSSYTIGSRKNAIWLFYHNKAFRECVQNGDFVYADGLLVLAQDKLLEYDGQRGLVPAAAVNYQVDRYCIRLDRYFDNNLREYEYSFSQDSLRALGAYPHREVSPDEVSWMKRKKSFHGLMTELMLRRNINLKELAESLRIPEDEIISLCTAEQDSYDQDLVVSLCVCLHLPPALSSIVLEKAGIDLDKEDRGGRRAILCLFYLDDIRVLVKSLAMDQTLSSFYYLGHPMAS